MLLIAGALGALSAVYVVSIMGVWSIARRRFISGGGLFVLAGCLAFCGISILLG